MINNKQKIGGKNLPLILVILDGWGISAPNKGNPISMAKTPTMNELTKEYPYMELCASGKCVGLPVGQVGNSEAGHMNIGAGRMVEQDVVKITRSIKDGTFFKNAGFIEAIKHVKKKKSTLHLVGLISNGMSPHSDPGHLSALLKLAKMNGIKNVVLHIFTDGRDSPKYASLKLIQELESRLDNGEQIATIIGRLYAMDRTKKWDRTEKAYNALVMGEGRKIDSAQEAITEAYNSGESDEFIKPYIIMKNGKETPRISEGDSVIFFNLRSDRARQLAKVFVQADFNRLNPGSFIRKKVIKDLHFIAMTDFGPDLDGILTVCPSINLKKSLPMQLGHLKQLYAAETEKYAHVTYFFNGGYIGQVAGEAQFMVASPDVKFYNETPEMSSKELTKKIINSVNVGKYDFTVLNYAAPDMIGHTGDLKAAVKCCAAIDKYLGKIVRTYLVKGGTVIITADHGNIEEMINLKTGEIDTEHSINKVPFLLVNKKLRKSLRLRNSGNLADIAPTILELIGLKKPKEMSGKSLIKFMKK